MFKEQTDSNVHFKSMFSFSKTGADEKERKKVKSLSHVRFLVTPWTVAYQAHPWNFPGRSTVVGCHFLLQEILPTQGSNLGLLHYRQTLFHLSPQGSPQEHMKSLQRYEMTYLNTSLFHNFPF